jgi:hypothetical protein
MGRKAIQYLLHPRTLAGAMYLAYLCAGIAFLFFSAESFEDATSPWLYTIWNTFLLAGGVLTFGGLIFKRPGIELAGVPLLCSTLAAYSVVLFAASTETEGGVRAAFGFLLTAAFFGLFERAASAFNLLWIALMMRKRGDG